MGTPTLVIGDLHGVSWVAERALETGLPVVFIGDYLDSYDKSTSDQLYTLDTVLRAVKERNDVEALMGNHEMSYLDPRMQCSGFSSVLAAQLMSDFDEKDTYLSAMSSYLDPFKFIEGFLISHAGVSQRLLREHRLTLEDALVDPRIWNLIGRARGGSAHVGGLFWCDWNHEFEPIADQPQIVGHTRSHAGEIRRMGNSYNIDCVPHNYHEATVAMIEDASLTLTHCFYRRIP